MKWNNKLNPELGSTLNWKKKLPYYCCCLVGRSVDLETTFFLFFHILIFYLKLCFCSYNKALTSSFFWLLLGNQSKSEIDLRWKISALFLSYCLLFWNDLEYIPTYIYHIFIFCHLIFFHYISWLFIWKEIDIFKVHVVLTSFFEESQFDEFYDTIYYLQKCGLYIYFLWFAIIIYHGYNLTYIWKKKSWPLKFSKIKIKNLAQKKIKTKTTLRVHCRQNM